MPIEFTPSLYKILIIDHDQAARNILQKALTTMGYQVDEADNGQTGFYQFSHHIPDLVLMAVSMPLMNGYDTIKAIRNYPLAPDMPIIMLMDDEQSIDQAFEVGATDFCVKPINLTLFSKRIQYTLLDIKNKTELHRHQKWVDYATKIAKLGYWEWDLTTDTLSGTPSSFNLMGIPYQEQSTFESFIANIIPKDLPLIHQAISESQQGTKTLQVSFRVLHKDESLTHIECLGESIFNEHQALVKMTGSIQDISRLHKAESLIEYQSTHDKLTDLPNRTLFNQHLSELTQKIENNTLSAVILLDIDRFKAINDNLGQEDGDALLQTVAQRLQKVTREEDFVARLGSDEFAIIIKQAKDTQEFHLSLNRIFKDISKPYMINNNEIFTSFSLGVAVMHQDGGTANYLLANANVARASAKAKGGNQFQLYQKEMNIKAKSQLILENDLYKALEKDEIEIYFQPQMHAKTLQPYGAEALVRWNHATHGIVSPEIFVPMAESTGLIVDIGRYMIEQGVKMTERWHNMGCKDFHIGINLSGRQFSSDNLMDVIQNTLKNTTLPAEYLDLEITESLAMSNADHNISVLNGLKALGVSLSIDDFGTGYSSLAYLHSFPVDALKIDQSFIYNLKTPEGQTIVNAIIAMAKSLNLTVIAEGIEEDFHVQFLQEKGCDIFQGFKFGKPMPAKEFENFLLKYKKN